jgi:sugar/nucleoside kinase (ribokinase family)
MKILGIGNAIVDVICKVDDKFIIQNNLTKSTMKLFFDETEFKNLLTNLKIEKTVSGGSVANSIVGLSQLGDKVGFIGKVSDDDFGSKYEEGLKKEKVEYFYSKKKGRVANRYLFNIGYSRLGENNVYIFRDSRKN